MSFRQFGGLNYAARHNIVSSNYNTSNNLIVSQNVGQPNSYINFLSDISGNISIYGDFDLSGNLNVTGDISANSIYATSMRVNDSPQYYPFNNSVVPKSYVNAASVGIKPLSECLCATTGPITLSGLQTIDGYAVQSGNRVLVKNQNPSPTITPYAGAPTNGVYVASSGAWTLATDFSGNMYGATVFVQYGTLNNRTTFLQQNFCDTNAPSSVPPPGTITTPTKYAFFVIYAKLGALYGNGLIFNPNTDFLTIDPSLNYISSLDGSNNLLNIGTRNTTTGVNIGRTGNTNNITGNTNITGTLGVSGATTLSSTLGVSGATTLSSTLNAGASTLSSLNVTNNASVGGNLNVNGIGTFTNQYIDLSNNNGIIRLLVNSDPYNYIESGSVGGTSVSTKPLLLQKYYSNDPPTMFLDVANNRVGINKFTPTTTLDVNGNTNITGTLGVSGATTLSSTLNAGASTLSSLSVTNNASVGGTLGVTGLSTLSSLSVTNNASVGGTLGVTGNITASGTASTIGKLYITNDGTNFWLTNSSQSGSTTTNYALYQGSSGNTQLNSASGQNLLLSIGNSSIATITSTGVGIGTSTPGYKLDVYGTGRFGTYSGGYNNQVTNAKLIVSGDSTGTYASDIGQLIITGSTNQQLRLGLMVDTTNNITKIQGGNSTISTLPLCLNSAGGSVGIGTSSPQYTLDVNGTLGVSGATTLSSTLGVSGATTLSNTLGVSGATTLSSLVVNGATTFNTSLPTSTLTPSSNSQLTTKTYVDNLISSSTTNLLAANNTWTGTNRFNNSVTAANSLGITGTLDVSGNTLSSKSNPVLTLNGGSSGLGGPYLQFYGAGSQGANVGINLDTFGGRTGGPATTIQSIDMGGYSSKLFFNVSQQYNESSSQFTALSIVPNSTSATANVGINTNNPSSAYSLDVVGNILTETPYTASGIYPASNLSFGTSSSVPWFLGKIQGYVAAGTSGSTGSYPGGLAFYTKSPDGQYGTTDYTTLKMVLDANGNLGIGTSTPGYTLDVNGIGRFGTYSGGYNNQVTNAKLIVSGDATGTFASDSGQLIITGSTNQALRLGLMVDTTNNVVKIQGGNSNVGTLSLCLNSGGGNVGIGTTTPGYTLDVNGNTNVTGSLTISNGLTVSAGTISVPANSISTAAISGYGNDLVTTNTTQTISGTKTFSTLLTASSSLSVNGTLGVTGSSSSSQNTPVLTISGGTGGVSGAYLQLYGPGSPGANVGINFDTFTPRSGGPATSIQAIDMGGFSSKLFLNVSQQYNESSSQFTALSIIPLSTSKTALIGINKSNPSSSVPGFANDIILDISGNTNIDGNLSLMNAALVINSGTNSDLLINTSGPGNGRITTNDTSFATKLIFGANLTDYYEIDSYGTFTSSGYNYVVPGFQPWSVTNNGIFNTITKINYNGIYDASSCNKIDLYTNSFGQNTGQYGFGLNAGTVVYNSGSNHQFYTNSSATGGNGTLAASIDSNSNLNVTGNVYGNGSPTRMPYVVAVGAYITPVGITTTSGSYNILTNVNVPAGFTYLVPVMSIGNIGLQPNIIITPYEQNGFVGFNYINGFIGPPVGTQIQINYIVYAV